MECQQLISSFLCWPQSPSGTAPDDDDDDDEQIMFQLCTDAKS